MKIQQRIISARAKEALLKDNEEQCCGGCCWFRFEDTDGWGVCPHLDSPIGGAMHCSDLCTAGKYFSEAQKRHYIAVLLQHNRWRRDDNVPNHCKPVNVYELGKAIDFAVEFMRVF